MASLIFVMGLAPALAAAQAGGSGGSRGVAGSGTGTGTSTGAGATGSTGAGSSTGTSSRVGSGAPGAPAGNGTGIGAGAPGSNAKGQSSVQIDSKSLVGSTVRGEDGNDVGKVANLMIDPSDGKVTSVVVTMGRTIGVGGTGVTLNGKDITVPWNEVKVGRDRDKFVVTLLQGALPATERSTKTR